MTKNNNLPGLNGSTSRIKLDKDWFQSDDVTGNIETFEITSKVKTRWWEVVLQKLIFGLYKPTVFWYKLKPLTDDQEKK